MNSPNDASLTQLFNKFNDREIPVTETEKSLKIGGKTYKFTEAEFTDPNHQVLQEIRQTAQDIGLKLRIFLPDTRGTFDYREDRMNVHINKDPDGKYRVKGFNIG